MVDGRDRKRRGLGYRPGDPDAVSEYTLQRDARGGGMAAAMVLAAGRSALKRLRSGAQPDEVEELWRLVMNAVRVEERLNRARARQPLRDDGLARAR